MSNAGRQRRLEVADFWDAYLARWLTGDENLRAPLDSWFEAYAGQLDLWAYPDPFVGNLRGVADRPEPKIVVLGVNPGGADRGFQDRGGLWANKVLHHGLSRCFERHPEGPSPEEAQWREVHGRRSRHWVNVMSFVRRWNNRWTIDDVLAMELYPWHSRGWNRKRVVRGGVETLADLAREYIFEPIAEVKVDYAFSFTISGSTSQKTCSQEGW